MMHKADTAERKILLACSGLIFLSGLIGTCVADNVTFLRIDRSIVQQRIQQAPQTPEQRVQTLRVMFEKAGCTKDKIQVQTVPDQAFPNVICTLPGSEYGTILIASRLDYDSRGDEGAVGWGGVMMLPLLAESLTSTNHRHTLVFAAFSGTNTAGASWYWKNLSDAQRREFRGVVDLDHVGRTAAAYSTIANGAVMARLLPAAAKALRIDPDPQPVADVPEGYAAFFQRAHVPSITIYSAGYVSNGAGGAQSPVNANPLLPNDVHQVGTTTPASFALKTALDPATYDQTYNLLCVYVLFLDRGLGASKHPAPDVQVAKAEAPKSMEAADAPPRVTAAPVPLPDVLRPAQPTMPSSGTEVASAAPGSSVPNTSAGATIHVNARLVQFDVVVTDSQGRPVKDLTAADFTVLQDGKPQSVRAFELHSPAVDQASTPVAGGIKPTATATAANTYTNVPAKAPQNSWTVVLFDVLNTAPSDQAYARSQLLQLLKGIPAGKPVALFVLTQRLEMLQGFTEDPKQLVQMAELLDPAKSQILTTMVERERTVANIIATAQQAAPAVNTGAGGGGFSSDSMVYNQASRIEQSYNDYEAFRTTDRVRFTLEAMQGLARAVSGYPGRKNLIWLSGSFPVQIEPDPASPDEFRNVADFQDAIRQTGSLLATSRVAVYPVDVRGLQMKGVDISVATAENQVMSDVAPGSAHGVISTSASNAGATINAETVALSNDRITMKSMAEQTGGEAFVNTNDLKRVINRSLEDGSTYYTLAYTPPKEDPGGGYHRVVVKLPNKGLKLAYRRGYYSIPQQATMGEAGTAALRAALQPGMPPSTSMLLTASIEPPDGTRKDVKINYVINSDGVDFADVPDNKKRAQLDCMVIAFDASGKEVAHASDTLDATIPLNVYATVQQYGLPAHQLISLPPGRYNLRIGIMDKTTQQIGTVDAPLVVPNTAVAQR